MVYWLVTREHTVGNDVAVEKSKAKTCRFVESKNGLSLSQIVALFLSVLSAVGESEKDCHHIFEQCRLSPKPLGRPHLMASELDSKPSGLGSSSAQVWELKYFYWLHATESGISFSTISKLHLLSLIIIVNDTTK